MWEKLSALLFFGISRKGWRSESESKNQQLCWGRGSPGLAMLGVSIFLPWLEDLFPGFC